MAVRDSLRRIAYRSDKRHNESREGCASMISKTNATMFERLVGDKKGKVWGDS
jgi:hypothetical protein